MIWLGKTRERPWWITTAAVGGLLVAIIVVGVVGLLLNQRVNEVTEEALRYDVELEDHGDDLRVAVLDVRHYHRNIAFTGVSRGGIADFEEAYERLQVEIDELEELGVRDPGSPQPQDFRRMSGEYYDDFRPAVELYETDRAAFDEASDRGLQRIDEMENDAQEIDQLGEALSAESLQKVNSANTTARLVLLAVIGGLLLAGAVLAYAAVRVVSELRRLYAEQQKAAEKLAEAAKAKTEFLADVSHELRTPLTVIRGNAQVGLQLESDRAHSQFLEEIMKESSRMTRMVEDLLFLARSDDAALPFEPEPTHVRSLLAEVAGRAQTLAQERGAHLDVHLSGDGEVEAEARRIEQAVLILVDNAAKYGSPGGTIQLTSTTESGELCVAVSDDGPGIPEKDLPHVFERFYRVDKTRARKLGGAGLGLPIAKTIVESHGGRIETVSREGEGTTISIHLPLLSQDEPTEGLRSEDRLTEHSR
jgi:two-component system, OmpR family, sensor histidine kinase VicK